MALVRLQPGQMRDRISILRVAETNDGNGNLRRTWGEVAQPWALVEGIDGREAVLAQALQGVSHYRIRIWWRADKPGGADQVRLPDGTLLNIRSCVDPFGDRRELSILADTGQAEAVQ